MLDLKSEFYLKFKKAKKEEFLYLGLIIYNEDTNIPELIVNYDLEAEYKVNYINRVYDENLRLKANNKIYIKDYIFTDDFDSIRKLYNEHYHNIMQNIIN